MPAVFMIHLQVVANVSTHVDEVNGQLQNHLNSVHEDILTQLRENWASKQDMQVGAR